MNRIIRGNAIIAAAIQELSAYFPPPLVSAKIRARFAS
jgi:hypothetical protein